jgi:tetratricopeptide (TPR) repeat protein
MKRTTAAAVLAILALGAGAPAFAQGSAAAKPSVSAAVRFNQGIDALDAKKYAEADIAFGDVLAAKQDDWEAAYMRGQAQHALNNLAGAKTSFETALRVQPGLVDARGHLGAIDKKLGDTQDAADQRAALVESQTRCGGTCSGAKQIDAAIAMIDAAS